jgi:SARP family transcriptional regulator, regulator of embCAB operon
VLGEILGTVTRRLYLLGHLVLETPVGTLVGERLPGRQGRLTLVRLALVRSQAVPRDVLAEALWPAGPPQAWDTALSAVVSKLRGQLAAVGLDGVLRAADGCYELRLPGDVWVDAEDATRQLDRAEGMLRAGEIERAWGPATVALAILRRQLLPGEEGAWVETQRARLEQQRLRASDALIHVWLARGQGGLAQQLAEEAITVAPLRETGHRLLMRAHLAQDNPSQAVVAYHRCRDRLLAELGVEPAPATEHVYRSALAP